MKIKRLFLYRILLIIAFGILSYSNTLYAPFQWDDSGKYFADNPLIKDLRYFIDLSEARESEFYKVFRDRYIGYLTFALNYRLHGFDVTGYHVVNIAIHLINSLLVYLLVALTFKTSFLRDSSLAYYSSYIAFFSGLLFVSHPVQIEAVTYVFQRFTSLAATFYLGAIVFYIKWRLGTGRDEDIKSPFSVFYLLSVTFAVLAMKTKEIAFTLPTAVMLYEFLFFSGPVKRRILNIVPLFLTMLIIPLTIIDFGGGISGVGSKVFGEGGTPVTQYLFTEFRVIVSYIRLVFFPINQNIDYDYHAYRVLFKPQVLLSFLFLLLLFIAAVYLAFRSRSKEPGFRLLSFGIFWFFLALSVESSVIPVQGLPLKTGVPMYIAEYRMYLPSAGAFIALASGAFLLFESVRGKRAKTLIISVLALTAVMFSSATYARNAVWGDTFSLWSDTIKKSPFKARPYNNVANAYSHAGNLDEAIRYYRISAKIDPNYEFARFNLGYAYMLKGDFIGARREFEAVFKISGRFRADATLYLNYINNEKLTQKP